MSAIRTADNLETVADLAAVGVWVASENMVAELKDRAYVAGHNAHVARVRAARAARRDAQIRLGRDLQARYLASRAN